MKVEEAIAIAFPNVADSFKETIAIRYITVATGDAVKVILLGYSQPHLGASLCTTRRKARSAVASGVIPEFRNIEEAGKRSNWRSR